jgi:hypothetical protein
MKKVILLGVAFFLVSGLAFSQKNTNFENKPHAEKVEVPKEKVITKKSPATLKKEEIKVTNTPAPTTTKATTSTEKETGGIKPTNTGVVLPKEGVKSSTGKKTEN